jgi:hypothetical protein
VRDGFAKEVAHCSGSVSEVIKQPHGYPVIVKEPVNDSLQVDQSQDHGLFTPWFRVAV